MATDRLLIDYLPHYMQEYLEIKEIMKVEQPEIDSLWDAVEKAFADQYILEASEYGISRWETILQISPKDTDTLDERRFRILTRLNQELPYTLTRMREVLINLCGEDGFSIELNAAEYHIQVKLALVNKNNYQDVVDLVNKMIPANMTQVVQVMYNANALFTKYRHMDLTAYTHETIRSEVFNDA